MRNSYIQTNSILQLGIHIRVYIYSQVVLGLPMVLVKMIMV